VSQKSILDIFDSNMNKNYQILVIFGGNIPDTTCHQITIQFFTSSSVCFGTTSEKKTKQNMRWNMQKKREKTSPTLLVVTRSMIIKFQ